MTTSELTRAPGAAAGLGVALVLASAVIWSFGGAIARAIEIPDPWTVVFWRSVWAAAFLVLLMLARDGLQGTRALFRNMGWPGLLVGSCFATASTTFIVALSYTTVANILLIQASVPLLAALFARIVFRERVAAATWAGIAAVILGIGVMVSDSLSSETSFIGNALSMLIALALATATLVTRRCSHVRMTPACCVGTLISMTVSGLLAGSFAVSAPDMALLFAFGALNLGLGLALFASGARLVQAPIAALVGAIETVLGPFWVWLAHSETPSERTLIGGAIVLAALVAHIVWQWRSNILPAPPVSS